tara:strand:- start:5324 stop:6433 length:1110 start_codon:yes stop_codon:yes gene_type:complete
MSLLNALISPADKQDAALMGLLQLGSQFANRGAPRLTPTPPPIDLAGPLNTYRQGLNTALQRGMMEKQLKDEQAMRGIFKNPALTTGLPTGIGNFVQSVGATNPTAAMSVMGPILAAQAKNTTPSSLREINQIHSLLQNPNLPPAMKQTYQNRLKKLTTTQPMFMNQPKDYFGDMGLETWKTAAKEAAVASQKLFTLNEMDTLLKTGTPTGSVQKLAMPFQRILAEFGVNNKNLGVQEAMSSIGDELALGKHGPGMGPMTDPDFRNYQNMVPGMRNTEAGNALIMQRMKRDYIGKQIYADVLREQITKKGFQNVSASEAWREVARRLDRTVGPMIPTFATVAELNASPKNYTGMVVLVSGKPKYLKPGP